MVDFKSLSDRLTTYRAFEQQALARREACLIPGLAQTADVSHRCGHSSGGRDRSGHRPMTEQRPLLTAKERMAIDRVAMPEQDPAVRAVNFREVNLGLTQQIAMLEAERCLQCPKPYCIDGCPVSVNIPRFLKLLREGDLPAAADSLLDDNALPCVTGRVCPQETQCEGVCLRAKKGNSGRHRPPRAIRRRLGAGASGRADPRPAAADRQDRRDRRLRPGRA